ncbi:hypothetical protein McanMca71_002306 [Microsporum canis]|uniref:Monocarboxylate permease-like protein n=1 Tax=Arthroderma otae (strain ATCC MYA-4605 / CBS 113480) TaxID=554155 RepID=C5FL45_ARTOC|nr:monocarboxylate permease-like protein [Microsporum canis CBS 113480]EEQ30417.1 monocarboxylate permease-like protein [Microsporum canis CBS 113480]
MEGRTEPPGKDLRLYTRSQTINSSVSTITQQTAVARINDNSNWEKRQEDTADSNPHDAHGMASGDDTDVEQGPDIVVTPKDAAIDPSSYPDGGIEAWTVVFGGFCALFVSFGWINCVGIFQDYYQAHDLKSYSPSSVAWIPSLELFMMYIVAPLSGKGFDNFGPRYLLIGGSAFHVFGLMMTSLSSEYYQFLLAQGVCSPLGAGFLFYSSMNSTVTWFYRKRALAVGIVASGSSLGGIIMPIMITKLIPMLGFPWAMRVCAFLILALCTVACSCIRARIPPHPRPLVLKEFFTPFLEMPFVLLTAATFLYCFGMFLPFTFLVLHARRFGVPDSLASYLVSIFNAASIFGRTIPGYAADRMGLFNVVIIMSFFSVIVVFAIWIPSHGTVPDVVFAILFGFASGSLVSLPPSLVAYISDVRQIGVRSGAMFATVSIAVLLGNPIGGSLVPDVVHGDYWRMQVFSGSMLLAGSMFFVFTRVRLAGTVIMKKI